MPHDTPMLQTPRARIMVGIPRGEGRLRRAASRGLAALISPWLLPWLVAGATFAVFWPGLWNGFVEWDDHVNLFENPSYRGLGWQHIRWMFTTALMGHYIPVTWLTFGLDYTLWGMNPLGYHLTNNLLHAASAAVVYLVALRLVGAATSLTGPSLRLAAAMAALFFAVHPLRAESVAWATERRDVLSGLFFLLTVLTYLRAQGADGARRRRLLAVAVGCFALGFLSKSIVMTLPLLLVVLDIYPLGRLSWLPWRWTDARARAALLEKIPFLVVAVAGGAIAYWAVAHQDYVTPLGKYPWSARIGMTFYSYWFYLWKTVWPTGLSPLYELPLVVDPLAPRFLGAAIGVGAVTALVLALAVLLRWPAGLAAWLYYGIFLGPVTGIVHAGHQLTHDRYSYLSCLGLALLFGAAVGAMARDRGAALIRPGLLRLAAAVAAVWILALATLTWYQVQVWRDTDSLWRYGVEADPECSICHSNLASHLLKQAGLDPQATAAFEESLRLRPDRHRTRSNFGMALARVGETDRALDELFLAVRHLPGDPDALSNLGGLLVNQGRYDEAHGYLSRALHIRADHPAALANLGVLLTSTGRAREALGYIRRSIELKPDDPVVRVLLARAHLSLGEFEAAGRVYEDIARLDVRVTRRFAAGLVWF